VSFKNWFVIAGLIGLVGAAVFAAEPPAPPPGWTDGYVIANGIRIHYWRTGGDKPVLVMSHGSSDDGLCWTALAKELEADCDIVMPDARGHGLTDPPLPSDPTDAQAEDLAALIKELKLEKPIVMGHSMGAAATAWFAAKYPDVPRAVVLEDPVRITGRTGPRGRATTAEAREKRRARVFSRNNMTFGELVADCMKNSPSWGLTECQTWAPSKRRHHPNTAIGPAAFRPAFKELFPKITAPTLILKADAEPEERKQNEEAASLLPNGKIVHIDGAGHNVRREQKQRLLEVLKPFLAGL